MVYQGPVRPGTDEDTFRETGRSVQRSGGGGYQGPVRPGRDEEIFRQTGQSVEIGSVKANQIRQQQEQARQAEAKRFEEQARAELQEKLAQQEKQRILDLKKRLIEQGKQQQEQILKNKEGQRIKVNIIKSNDQKTRVVERTNLDTGEKTYQSFKRTSGGGYSQSGVTSYGLNPTEIKNVEKNLKEQGLKVIKNNEGQIIGFSSPDTQKTYKYTNAGIESFTKDSQRIDSIARQNIRIQKETGMSIKPQEGRLLSLANKYAKDINTNKNILTNSFNSRDLQKLGELKRRGKINLSSSELAELKRLEKVVANNYKIASQFIGKTVAVSLINLGLGSVSLIKNLATNPINTIKNLPPALIRGLKEDFKRAGVSPLEAGQVALEYYTIGGAMKGVGTVSKSFLRQLSKLSPKYVKLVNGKFIIRKAPVEKFKVRGSTRLLKKRVQSPSIKRPFSSVADFLSGRKAGQFKKFTKNPGLILKSQTVKSGQTAFSKQIRNYSGKVVTAVNASANQLTSWLRKKTLIRKPLLSKKIGVNAYLEDYALIIAKDKINGKRIANILKKFDNGKRLSINEIVDISKWLKKNVAPNITLLERSLYVDPASGLRISRLGIQPEARATLRDLFKGNFKLKGNKPQVLIFEKAKLANVPKRIQQIANKIDKKGLASVTERELAEIIRWQLKPSTKFKIGGSPIYAGGIELEATGYGSYIKRLKQVGFRYIDGKKVTFVTAELWKPSKIVAKQLKLAQLGKLAKNQIKALEKLLSKKLGRKIKVETPALRKIVSRQTRRSLENVPVIRIRPNGVLIIALRDIIRTKGVIRKIIKPFKSRVTRTTKRATRKLVSRKKTTRKSTTRTRARTSTTRKSVSRKRTGTRKPRGTTSRAKATIPRRRLTRRPSPRRPPRGTPKKPPVSIPIKLPKFKRKSISKKVPVFYVKEKIRGKVIRLTPKPLTLKDAKDFLAYRIDNRLSRSGWFEPLGKAKVVVVPPKNIQGYFRRNTRKFRPYKIRLGKRKDIRMGYIEKRKYIRDTPGEKAQLRRNKLRRISRKSIVRKPVRRKVKRKITPKQRRILIQRLKKARAVRMRNLRRRR